MINLVYIDDSLSGDLTEKLDKYCTKDCVLNYKDIELEDLNNLEKQDYGISQLQKYKVDILILDIKLYKNTSSNLKVHGYELYYYYKNYFPLIEIILISSAPKNFVDEIKKLELDPPLDKNTCFTDDKIFKVIKKKQQLIEFKKSSLEIVFENKSDSIKTFKDIVNKEEFSTLTDKKIDKFIDVLKGYNEKL